MKNFVIRYALYAGSALVIFGVFNWFVIAPMGYSASEYFGYASMIAALMAVPLAIKYYRDQLNQGLVSFGEGFKIGIGITSITSLIMGLYSTLFFVFAGEEFIEWSKANMSPEDWAEAETFMASVPSFVMSPWFQGIVMLLTVFFIGTIISILSSMTLKRN